MERLRGTRRASTNVAVVGLGKIGLSVAKHVSKYYPVTGYDISQEAVNRATKHGLKASVHFVNDDVYVIAVTTSFRLNAPDMSAVEDCCKQVSRLNPDALVCFESTLSVGTARTMSEKYDLQLVAVCPHRWWEADQLNHGVVQPRVLGALNPDSMKQAVEFYSTLGIPLYQVSSLEMAEFTKVVENTHRFLQIAFAEELKLISDTRGLDFEEVKRACNTKWNVDILEARNGIGGECLPKDIRYLLQLHPTAPLIRGAIQADHDYVQVQQNPWRVVSPVKTTKEPLIDAFVGT
jgi:nucleotide sugar dehydrogenase